jgi:hypothetical protein
LQIPTKCAGLQIIELFSLIFVVAPFFSLFLPLVVDKKKRVMFLPVITWLDDRVIKNLFTAHSLMLSGTHMGKQQM